MATDTKDELPTLEVHSPKGVAIWPKLNKPDDKFSQGNPLNDKWTAQVAVYAPVNGEQPSAEYVKALELQKTLDDFYETSCADGEQAIKDEYTKALETWEKKKKGSKPKEPEIKRLPKPWKVGEDEKGAYILFGFKMNARFKKKDSEDIVEMQPAIFDSKKHKIPRDKKFPQIGNGSTLKVAGSANYFAQGTNIGVTLKMRAVQLIDLRQYTGKSAEEYGFEEEEGEDGGFDSEASEGYDSTAGDSSDSGKSKEVDLSE